MSAFVDTVMHEKPAMYVTRGQRGGFWAIAGPLLPDLLRSYRFTMEYEIGDDRRYYGSLEQIPDIIGEGDSLEELRRNLAEYLQDYSIEYAEQWKLFFNAPNRRDHFPFILHVLTRESVDEVAALID